MAVSLLFYPGYTSRNVRTTGSSRTARDCCSWQRSFNDSIAVDCSLLASPALRPMWGPLAAVPGWGWPGCGLWDHNGVRSHRYRSIPTPTHAFNDPSRVSSAESRGPVRASTPAALRCPALHSRAGIGSTGVRRGGSRGGSSALPLPFLYSSLASCVASRRARSLNLLNLLGLGEWLRTYNQ